MANNMLPKQYLVANGYEFLKKWDANLTGNGQFRGSVEIAVDSSGNVYVVDTGTYFVYKKFDSNGTFIRTLGSNGTGYGQIQ